MERARVAAMVHQYLRESGHTLAALAMLDTTTTTETEAGAQAPDLAAASRALPAATLLGVLDNYADMAKGRELGALSAAGAGAAGDGRGVEAPGDGVFCNTAAGHIQAAGGANLLAVAFAGAETLLVADASSAVRVQRVSGLPLVPEPQPESVQEWHAHRAPVLSLAIDPAQTLALTGCMGGEALLCDLASGEVVFRAEKHRKYVAALAWSATGEFFATGGYDHELRVYQRQSPLASGEGGAAGGAGEGDAVAGSTPAYKRVGRVVLKGNVESVAFAGASTGGGEELVVAERDSHLLWVYTVPSMERRSINMNLLGDAFVSFNALHLTVSPSGRHVLVSTDKDRLILFDLCSGAQLRNFYGADSDCYSYPKHCWHPSGLYIYATSQSHDVLVWEVATQEIVTRLSGHTATIRDLRYCAANSTLVSCGFDKAVRFWTDIPDLDAETGAS